MTTFKVAIESDYIGTDDPHNPTSSQSCRPIPLPTRCGKMHHSCV